LQPLRKTTADYITGTGATVDRPGVPQASGPTALDRKIQEEDNRIDNSICSDCWHFTILDAPVEGRLAQSQVQIKAVAARRRWATAICANRTTGVDVELLLQIAALRRPRGRDDCL
jgi:hypothetical protein